jgi:hypothetical protein
MDHLESAMERAALQGTAGKFSAIGRISEMAMISFLIELARRKRPWEISSAVPDACALLDKTAVIYKSARRPLSMSFKNLQNICQRMNLVLFHFEKHLSVSLTLWHLTRGSGNWGNIIKYKILIPRPRNIRKLSCRTRFIRCGVMCRSAAFEEP